MNAAIAEENSIQTVSHAEEICQHFPKKKRNVDLCTHWGLCNSR